jgi:prepilin-type N-terminal cleavage/methylation domain-containing protein
MKNSAFTLIEMLIVVLVIGILAAIALPQYNRAVWRSRTTQLLQYVRNLAQDQERHYLVKGSYTDDFNELDISFDNLPRTSATQPFTVASLKTDGDTAGISTSAPRVLAVFLKGKYQYGAFVYFFQRSDINIGTLKRGKIYCADPNAGSSSPALAEKFCEKVVGASDPVLFSNTKYYLLPY